MKCIAKWLRNLRNRKAVLKWNSDLPLIKAMAKHHNDGPFYWHQLVWQEVWMHISIAEQVELGEFDHLCTRRGFDEMMKAYLAGMLRHVGLGKKLDTNIVVSSIQS